MKSYSSGNVSGNEEVGGLVGRNDIDSGSTVTESYWDTETSNQSTSAGSVIGLTTAEITGSAASTNMVNLDFTSEWKTVLASDNDSSADSYPIIQSNDRKAQLVSADLYDASTSSVDVIVEDSEGNAISGATVEIDGTDGATQDLTDGQYNITASADGYDTLSEDITVDGAAETVTVTLLEESTYSVNVLAVDSEGNAITEYTVEIDGKSGGYLPNGTYTITASADGYDTLSQDITVDGEDKTVTVTLSESTYSVDVLVEDSEGNAISGATVEIDGTDGATQDLADGQYNITASADSYYTLSQDITVDGAAETVTVTLSEEEEAVIVSESSSEEYGGMSTLVYASVVAFFGIFIMVVFLFGKD
jgi:flagellar hook assembly protein FlgD